MKAKEELDAIKGEYKALQERLAALTEEELEQVFGGYDLTEPETIFLPEPNRVTDIGAKF